MTDKQKLPDSTLEHIARDQLTLEQTAAHLGFTAYELQQTFDLNGVQFAAPQQDSPRESQPMNPPV